MKYKFISSNVDEATRISDVVVEVNGRRYMGTAICHEDDKFSKFQGCYYAENRAYAKSLKVKLANKKAQLFGVERAYTMLNQTKDCNYHSVEMQQMRKMIKILKKEVEEIKKTISSIEPAIKEMDNAFQKNKTEINT